MKKMFAVLMIAMMIMCFMPIAAFADAEYEAKIGETSYGTLDAAVAAAADGATIILLKDCSTEGFNLNKKIYLYNDIPKGILYDEIEGFAPVIINGDLSKIKEDF